jgi:GR25 family glycosyltransferase involved in LPS biosynthesis
MNVIDIGNFALNYKSFASTGEYFISDKFAKKFPNIEERIRLTRPYNNAYPELRVVFRKHIPRDLMWRASEIYNPFAMEAVEAIVAEGEKRRTELGYEVVATSFGNGVRPVKGKGSKKRSLDDDETEHQILNMPFLSFFDDGEKPTIQ